MADSARKPDVDRFEGCLVGLAVGEAPYRPLLQAALDRVDARLAQLRELADAERNQAVRQGIQARIHQFAAEADKARAASASDTLDAETLSQLEFRLNRIHVQLNEVVWHVRLEALFSRI